VTELFLRMLNMSITAGWVVIAVVFLRLALKRAPKRIIPVLWAIVALRLVMPIPIESRLSLIPSAETVSPDIIYAAEPTIHSGIPALNSSVNPYMIRTFAPEPAASANPLQIWGFVLSLIWLAGMAVMLIYAAASYVRLRLRVRTAVRLHQNIYQSERVASPFVLGVLRPRIYMPFSLGPKDEAAVTAHEQMHIKRRDHLIKPLGFLLLSLYWYNPLIWLAYMLLSRDIELACDEAVIKDMDEKQRADYSQALLSLGTHAGPAGACPLAFGEVGVKGRIKSVLSYKKPALWIIAAAVVVCAVSAVCFLTSPKDADVKNPWVSEYVPGQGNAVGNVDVGLFTAESPDFEIGADRYGRAVFKNPQKAFKTLREKYKDGIELIRRQFALEPLSESRYEMYKTYGWQVTEGTERERAQANFVTRFLDIYENSFIEGGSGPAAAPTVPDGLRRLTLEEVSALSLKGDELGWADFEDYQYREGGSGLYIRIYEIDEMFSLLIGGVPDENPPMYIYLKASDGYDEMIDIRTEGVGEFIEFHKDNPVVKELGYSWQASPVGDSDAIFSEMIRLGGGNDKMVLSSVRYLPAVRVKNRAELDAFVRAVSGEIKEKTYDGVPSFSQAAAVYDDGFFDGGNELVLVCADTRSSQDRVMPDYVRTDGGVITIGLNINEYDGGDGQRETWLVTIALREGQTADDMPVEAQISSVSYPERTFPNGSLIRTYVSENSDSLGKRSISLYDSGEFVFTFSPVSSYLGCGYYTEKDGRLTLRTMDEAYVFALDRRGDTLVFSAGESTAPQGRLWPEDGEVFR